MTRLLTRGSTLAVAFLIGAAACGVAAEGGRPVAVGSQASGDIETRGRNPFQFYRYSPKDVGVPTPVADCVKLRLQASDINQGDLPQATLHVENRCAQAIAVLTGPIEVRLRLTKKDRFPAELMDWAVYSLLYVFSKNAGLPQDTFRGDGGFEVKALPAYYSVAAGGSADVPIRGENSKLHELLPGSYGVSILTPVVFAMDAAEFRKPFDVGLSVEKHNETALDSGSPSLRLPPAAVRLSAAATFTVR